MFTNFTISLYKRCFVLAALLFLALIAFVFCSFNKKKPRVYTTISIRIRRPKRNHKKTYGQGDVYIIKFYAQLVTVNSKFSGIKSKAHFNTKAWPKAEQRAAERNLSTIFYERNVIFSKEKAKKSIRNSKSCSSWGSKKKKIYIYIWGEMNGDGVIWHGWCGGGRLECRPTKSTTAILKWWCAADAHEKMELPRGSQPHGKA